MRFVVLETHLQACRLHADDSHFNGSENVFVSRKERTFAKVRASSKFTKIEERSVARGIPVTRRARVRAQVALRGIQDACVDMQGGCVYEECTLWFVCRAHVCICAGCMLQSGPGSTCEVRRTHKAYRV